MKEQASCVLAIFLIVVCANAQNSSVMPTQVAQRTSAVSSLTLGHYTNAENAAEYLDFNPDGSFSWRVAGRDFAGTYSIRGEDVILRFPPVGATARGSLSRGQFRCCTSNGLSPADTKLIDDDSKVWNWQQPVAAASNQPPKSEQVGSGLKADSAALAWRAQIDSARAEATKTPPYNGDWRSFITLKLSGTQNVYDQLYLAAVSRRSIALDRLAAADRFLARGDTANTKAYLEKALLLTIDSENLMKAANNTYAQGVSNTAAVLNGAYRVSSQSAAALGYVACGQPCYDGIDAVTLLTDYAVDTAIQGKAVADRNAIESAVIKVLLDGTGIGGSATSRVTHFIGQPDSVHVIVDQVLHQPQFRMQIMQTLGRSSVYLTGSALSAAADALWQALSEINVDCGNIEVPSPSAAPSVTLAGTHGGSGQTAVSGMTFGESSWTTLKLGQSSGKFTFSRNGALSYGGKTVYQLPADADIPASSVRFTPPAPVSNYITVLRWDEDNGGMGGLMVDAISGNIAVRSVSPPRWRVMPWVSWSPDGQFALLAASGEVTMGNLVLVNVRTQQVSEIHFSDFSRDHGRTELQVAELRSLEWVSPSRFRVRILIRCNPYELPECDSSRVISIRIAEVELPSLRMRYSAVQPAANPPSRNSAALNSCPNRFLNPVVPDGCLGEFSHGTPVKKTGSGGTTALVVATPATATHTHPGVDLIELDEKGSAKCGGPIYPLADGEVIDLIQDPNDPDFGVPGKTGLGYMVMLRHSIGGSPYYSLYLHMQGPPNVTLHQRVQGGTSQLGKIGSTGAAAGCHTHFEIRHFPTRYLEDCLWNYPSNIYGKGYLGKSDIFQDSWEDPAIVFANNNQLSNKPHSQRESLLADLATDGSNYFLAPFLYYANGTYKTVPGGTDTAVGRFLNNAKEFNLYQNGKRVGCFSVKGLVKTIPETTVAAAVMLSGTVTGAKADALIGQADAVTGPVRHEGFWKSGPTPAQQAKLLSKALGLLPKNVPTIPKELLPLNFDVRQMGKPMVFGQPRVSTWTFDFAQIGKREVYLSLNVDLKTSLGPFATGSVSLLDSYEAATDSWRDLISCPAIDEGGQVLWGNSACTVWDVLDIDGDGVAEVIVRRGYGEVGDIEIYSVVGGQLRMLTAIRAWTGS